MSSENIGIVETARRLAGYGWIEARLFELTGGWAPTVAEPSVKVALSTHSRHFGWRAQVWAAALPKLWDHPRDGSARTEYGPLVDSLSGADNTRDRLTGLYRVALPQLLAAYREHLEELNPVADAATARWLRIVAADLASDAEEGESLLRDTFGSD